MKFSVFSFFAGAGFLDLGFERTGFDVEFVNEAYAPFLGGYRHARINMDRELKFPKYGYHRCDVAEFLDKRNDELNAYLNDATKKGLVGFIGGPPCPDFSVGGKNAGAAGKHGNLSQVYVDLICQHQPDFFFFENVKGLISTKAHKLFFDSLLIQLIKAGYAIDCRVINAIEYGVPQDRQRVILVGLNKKKFRLKEEFLQNYPWDFCQLFHASSVLNPDNWLATNKFSPDDPTLFVGNRDFQHLTVQHWFNLNDVENHSNAKDYFLPKSPKVWEVAEGDVSKKSFKRLHRWRYSPTVAYGNNEVHLHPYKPRRLSVAEALAIQSLPKDFTLPVKGMTLTDKFKTVGNGVPYLMAKGLAEGLKEYIINSICN